MRGLRPLLMVILFALSSGASCGHGRGSETTGGEQASGNSGQANPGQGNSGQGNSGQGEGAQTTSAEAQAAAAEVPLPPLPELEPAVAPRTPPRITTVDQAEAAFRQGFYDAVAAHPVPGSGASEIARIALLDARLAFLRGDYARAAELAGAVAREHASVAATPWAAKVLRAEALHARGRLDDAKRALREVVEGAPANLASAFRARCLLGELLHERGRGVEAEPLLYQLIDAYNDDRIGRSDGEGLGYVARAALLLGSVHDANDAFTEATRADKLVSSPTGGQVRVETQVAWARLFLSKYDAGHAEECLNDALAVNPEHPTANALMAQVRVDQAHDFAAAEELIGRALAVNPNLAEAHVGLAGIALLDLDTAEADRQVGLALATNAEDLQALSMRAAIRYLADDQRAYEAARREVYRRNRNYTGFYPLVGQFAEWEHRYPDLVAMAREATTVAPEDPWGHAALGLNLLRMGDEAPALEALHSAWRRDRFNVRVFNTLNLYDEIIPEQYQSFDAEGFTFRMHNDERPMLSRYVPRTLGRAYRSMVERYGFTPEGPLRIEMFATSQHFALRTTGLPNLGVQGVCFGKVVTALSPKGGPFNWGQITWHELAHVFHIQLSRNHVPRWFTEGLAEYETNIAEPTWKRELDYMLWQAMDAGDLPPLRTFNRAFTRARSGVAMIAAYYASTRIVTYIAEEYGFEKLPAMLRAWGAGKTTEEIFREILGVDIDAFDAAFRAHERERLASQRGQLVFDLARFEDVAAARAAAEAAPEDAAKQAAYAAALLVHGEAESGVQQARRAIAVDPREPLARYILARAALSTGAAPEALEHLGHIFAAGRDSYELRLIQARAAMATQQPEVAGQAFEAAVHLDPEREEGWKGYLVYARGVEDAALVRRILERLVQIDEHGAEAYVELLGLLVADERWDEVMALGERALFVAPYTAEVHDALARAYRERGRLDDAAYEEASRALIQ